MKKLKNEKKSHHVFFTDRYIACFQLYVKHGTYIKIARKIQYLRETKWVALKLKKYFDLNNSEKSRE